MAQQIQKNYKAISIPEGAKAYTELRHAVTKAGLLDRKYFYYALHISGVTVGFFLSLYGIWITQNYWLTFVWSLVFAFFSIQYGGIVHDGGHRAIAKSVFWNDFWGQISGGLIAMGYSEWKPKHNAHHAHTNEVEEDPDVDIPLLSFTEERLRERKGWQRWLGRYQVYFYYPFGLMASAFLRIAMIKFIRQNFKFEYFGEYLVWFSSMVIWFAGPFIFFPLGKALIVFFTVHLASGWYVMHIFAPNHKGMPEIDKGVKLSFIEQQIITARNIEPHWLTDFVYMGLNYQIEHHLFPACPRPNLGKLTKYIKSICKKYNWEYTSCSVIQQDYIILKELVEMSNVVYGRAPAYTD
jgi:fatty acid desaturase